MKSLLSAKNWWLLLLTPFFIQGVCNKEDDDGAPNSDQYVTWQIPAHNGSLKAPVDSFMLIRYNNTSAVYGMNRANTTQFEVEFDGPEAPGSYSTNRFRVLVDGRYYVQTVAPVQVNVSAYGSSGQYLTGTFSGTVKDSLTSSNIAVSGSFKVKNW
jgi:hypothetical protein